MGKTILVDMDSIIADFYFKILELYEAETGDLPPADALATWDAKMPNGKDSFAYFSQPGFFKTLAPIPGARAFISKAKALGHDVLIVTSATLTNAPGEKFEWLSQYLPRFDRKQVIVSSRKDRVMGDVLIDDHAANTGPWLKANPGGIAIGIEYPYNVGKPEAFTHLVPSYTDFRGAWQKIDKLVLG